MRVYLSSIYAGARWRALFGLLTVLLVTVAGARAEEVVQTLPDGTVVTAAYQGGTQAPTVLILHGFLQTRDYLTVRALGGSLSDAGYTVLAPTLSLGVDRRDASLACEAVHTHTLDDDLAEVRFWIRWLVARGHQDIRLIGHSLGSLQLVALADRGGLDTAVGQVIATSLLGVDSGVSPGPYLAQRQRAEADVAAGDTRLQGYGLSFCRRYMAPAGSFLSYARWDEARLLQAVAAARVPVHVILAQRDQRMSDDWPARLARHGARVEVVDNAGHFFDNQSEFDLLDAVTQAMDAATGASDAPP